MGADVMTSPYDLDALAALYNRLTDHPPTTIRVESPAGSVEADFYAAAGAAMSALPAMIRDLREALEMLREVEWVAQFGESSEHTIYKCPDCEAYKEDGHTADCKLDALLKRIGRTG